MERLEASFEVLCKITYHVDYINLCKAGTSDIKDVFAFESVRILTAFDIRDTYDHLEVLDCLSKFTTL